MAYSHNAPFHADVVGSYLRPSELKVARMDFAAGTISAAELKAVEDKLITELVDIPTRRVLSALTVLEIDQYVVQHAGKHYTRAVTLTE